MKELRDRVALVTRGSRGIGAAVAIALAAALLGLQYRASRSVDYTAASRLAVRSVGS